ncbi:MAG: hypothetical protein ABI905_03630 [Betaproteobacteria bacterium]
MEIVVVEDPAFITVARTCADWPHASRLILEGDKVREGEGAGRVAVPGVTVKSAWMLNPLASVTVKTTWYPVVPHAMAG